MKQLEMRHTLADDVLVYLGIIIESVEIGIRQNNNPRRLAEILTDIIRAKDDKT